MSSHSSAREGGFGSWLDTQLRPVVIVLHDPLLNGASISALRAVPLLREHGWRCAFWLPAPGPAFEWLAERGAEVRGEFKPVASGLKPLREPPGLRRRLRQTPGYLRRFREFLSETQPEVVHANSLFSFAEALSAHRRGFPTLLHIHDMAPASRKAPIAAWIAHKGVDQAIAASDACARSYARGDWRPGTVYEAAPMPETPFEPRESPRPFVVGTVGVISRRKGSDVFVAAAKRLLAERDDLEFRLVGSPDDPLEREWGEAVIAEAGAAGITHIPRADVPAELAGWDAFVMPSRTDPCPIVLLEAMSFGLPVIGARSDGIVEEIAPGCGLLVDSEDEAGLAGAISEVAAMPAEARRSMGAAGRRRVAVVFSLETQAAAISGAYERTLESAAGRSR